MIIWLASYPKSGNTWVRLFLNSLLYNRNNSVDINDIKIGQFPSKEFFKDLIKNTNDVGQVIQNCIKAQIKLNADKNIRIFKTHNAFWKAKGGHVFTNSENTLGIIYIVRDPRNVITSMNTHFNFNDYNKSLKFILNEKNIIGDRKSEKNYNLPTIISSWKNHYNSWTKAGEFKKKLLLIKYENLICEPEIEFVKITNFLNKIANLKFEDRDIKKAIENTNFSVLKKQEKLNGFKEKIGSTYFFNLGPNNNWKKILNDEIREKIEKNFRMEMEELNYL